MPQANPTQSKVAQMDLHFDDPTKKPPKPFLRWAGGKRRLASTLIETFPFEFDPLKHRFFEPFVGGGALTFALGDSK